MGEAARLAQRLRMALREEDPRAVEGLLRSGADPNLVLIDGAAAVHLAARARRPRGLRCLVALLRHGGDPNARSAEALTPVHVAAAWGCRRGLELLLSQGGDPALRDQDGLRPLDLAAQQGHPDCARVLRELDPGARAEATEREPAPRERWDPRRGHRARLRPHLETRSRRLRQDLARPRLAWNSPSSRTGLPRAGIPGPAASGHPDVTLTSTSPQTQPGRGDGGDTGPEAVPRRPSPPEPPDVADKDESSGLWNCSSEVSFVTAVEVSETEDPAKDRASPWARSLSHTEQGSPGVCPRQTTPRSVGGPQLSHGATPADGEADLDARLQALALTSVDLAGFQPPVSCLSLPAGSPAHGPPQEPPPGVPGLCHPPDDPTPFESDVAAPRLTEVEASATEDGACVLRRRHLPALTVSDRELLQRLRALGHSPGPVTPFTRPYYLRRLQEAQATPGPDFSGHSPELAEALRTGRIPDSQADEDALAQQFERPDPARRWREGVAKSSFTYLLLDPRETQDLPARAFSLTPAECLQTFVRAIFYVGKGTRARPDVHLWEALGYCGQPGKQACPKVRQIWDIWDSGRGVVSLHCFQHVVAVEAYTREACLVDALGIQTLTNQKQGHCYGVVAGWTPARRRRLGVHLLHRALLVFLAEGERELRPQDIQARG